MVEPKRTLPAPRVPEPESKPERKGPSRTWVSRAGAGALKLPIHAYRYSLSLLMGRWCRYLPTCSEYALEAIDHNGPWRGAWLMAARCSRCHPFLRLGGGAGFDPVPDIRHERHRWCPWRYGRWRPPRAD